jgi:hypothetical protein
MVHMDLTTENTNPTTSKMTQFYKKKKPVSLADSKLVVSFGVGVAKKAHASTLSVDQARELLLSNHPTSHLKKLAMEHGAEKKNSWRSALKDLRSVKRSPSRSRRSQKHQDDLCNFSGLSFESSRNGVVVGNIGVIAHSATPRACYASLVAAFATVPTVSNVRLRTPKFALNNFNRGIVQTDVRQELYPYNDAGLDGRDQIVGVGDTGKLLHVLGTRCTC